MTTTMPPEVRAALETELAQLRRKADKRRDEPGFAANVVAIDARVAEIQAQLAAAETPVADSDP